MNLRFSRQRWLSRPGFYALGILLGLFALAGCIQEFERATGAESGAKNNANVTGGQNSLTTAQPTVIASPTPLATPTPTPIPIPVPTDTPVPSTPTPESTTEPTLAPTPTPQATPTPKPTPTPIPTPTRPRSSIPSLNLQILGPAEGTRATSNAVVVHGTTRPGASVQVNGIAARLDGDGRFRAEVNLFPGFNFLSVVAADQAGNREIEVITVVLPPQPFVLEITEPKDQSVVSQRQVKVAGRTGSQATATVNGRPVVVDQLGVFLTRVSLETGPNVIEIIANNSDGQELTTIIALIYRP